MLFDRILFFCYCCVCGFTLSSIIHNGLSGNRMLRTILLFLTLIFIQTSAIANSIFISEVVIDSTEQEMELMAKKNAFIEVLVRASGQSNVGNHEEIKKVFPKIDEYITQIGYGTLQGQSSLILQFNPVKIRTLLTSSQLPYWGSPRPDILFWMVEDSTTHRQLVWEPSPSEYLKELRIQSKVRGLPATIPIGDFDDILAISVPDVWGGFLEPIAKATLRYKPSAVAVVKMTENHVSWKFYPNGNNLINDFPISGFAEGTKEEMMSQLVVNIANYYIENFALNLGGSGKNSKTLEVSNLQSAEDFFILERTLKGLNSVAALRIASLHDGKVIFHVNLLGSESIFHNELMNNRHFRRAGNFKKSEHMPDQPQTSNVDFINGEPLPLDAKMKDFDMNEIDFSRPEDENKNRLSLISVEGVSELKNNKEKPIDLEYQWVK